MKGFAVVLLGSLWPGFAPAAHAGAAEEEREEREEEMVQLELRVSGTRAAGTVTIDRGATDGVGVGDFVELEPREGGRLEGTVLSVDPRSATVELHDRSLLPPPGTRGRVWVPRVRLEELGRVQEETEPVDGGPEHPPWANEDEGWSEGMPLLAQVEAVQPEDRAVTWQARNYFIADQQFNSVGDRGSGFYRLGTDAVVDNLFGRGGELRFDGELNWRYAELPFDVDIDDSDLRVDRLSYLIGGTRYDRDRYQGGRFLIHDMPEFGLVDGAQWTRRLENGHRFGAIAGFQPEPNGTLESGHDFQIAGYYRWSADGTERLTATAGFQKTWHDGSQDRDLFVAKVRYLPVEGWRASGTVWVDLYDGSTDVNKGSGTEITQAILSANRTWENGNGVRVTYSHFKFPELLRNEFNPIDPAELPENRNDRLWIRGWHPMSDTVRVEGGIGLWDDEDEAGYDGELAVSVLDMFRPKSRAVLSVFTTEGEFSKLAGARAAYGWGVENGRWDVQYEFSTNDQFGFTPDNDDTLQHELEVGRRFTIRDSWDVALDGALRSFNEDESLTLAVYVQKNFRGTL